MRLEGKVAIVTGAGRGLGKAYSLRLAREGAKVVATDIIDTAGTVREIVSQDGTAIGLNVDVTSVEDTLRMAEETVAKFGRIDVLVNNAGVLYGLQRTPFEEIDPQLWDKIMAVNVKGVWLCAKAVAPQMKKQGKGKIINISSIIAFMGRPGMMHYAATKGAVISMTYAMAAELGDYNICVNSVAPGYIQTEASLLMHPMEQAEKTAQTRQEIKRVLYPDDLTGTIAFLASDDADAISGQTIVVDGGIIKH
jgi:NAD(P)-dependent dehydrogenase (short-subunit alcohol dehydrogenase family)